jgi:PKD repeat protein
MRNKLLVLLLGCTVFLTGLRAQDWVKMMQDPTVNFYTVQAAFNKYWEKNERRIAVRKIVGGKESQTAEENYEKYKRWEFFAEQRVYPSGDRSLIGRGGQVIQNEFINQTKTSTSIQSAGNWTLMGPTSQISSGGGAGRVNCVRFDPSNPNIVYAGAPSGGLWKSINGGVSWSTSTDKLAVMGISDIAVDPVNSSTVYIATGDGDATDSYSNGILKTTDGGLTWHATGLNFNVIDNRKAYRIIINPSNHNMLLAGTSVGVYKSLDAGVTWAKCMNVAVRDLAFRPGDTTVVYAITNGAFYRSVNTGNSFTLVNSGTPSASSICRLAMAVTAADPNYVYLLAANTGSYNFHGVYRSIDGGLTFTTQATTPNLLGFNTNGGDTGGQGWYTLSLAASPTNKNEIVTGGVNIWHSTTGGSSWTCLTNWSGSWGGFPYVHADIHCLNYVPGNGTTFLAGCDGGVFKTTNSGAAWTDLSNGLEIGEMYRLGVSQTNSGMVVQGWQDNGTNQYDIGSSPIWNQVYGGDGMECFIDYTNTNYQYAETYNGGLARTTNNWSTSQNISNGITGTGAWVTPWGMDPVNPAILYAGFQDIWKSTNRGTNWTKISSFGGGSLNNLAIAKSNPQYIYTGTSSNLWGTTNGGTSWTNLSAFLPGNTSISHIEVSTIDPNIIWLTYSGYTANSKVFKSRDGGHTWINLSASLPNLPVNCSVNQPGTPEGVYIGTDVGIYYRDTTLANWVFYSNGLPNVVIDELEIQVNSKTLFAATYGRGLWSTKLYDPTSILPLANFKSDITNGCPGMSVQFTDLSTNGATSWAWTFAGGNPATSSAQNPTVVFNNPGTYNMVMLTATNANGSDSITKYSYIQVSPNAPPTISSSTGKDTVCAGNPFVLTSSFGASYVWSPGGSINAAIAPSTSGSYTVTVKDSYGCLTSSAPFTIVINPAAAIPVITQHGDTLVSSSVTGNQWYLGAAPISGATGQQYVINGQGNFTDHVTVANGCTGISNIIAGISENQALENAMNLFPNPTDGVVSLKLSLTDPANYTIRISDVAGRLMFREQIMISGNSERTYNLTPYGKGVYLFEIQGQKGMAVKKVIVY